MIKHVPLSTCHKGEFHFTYSPEQVEGRSHDIDPVSPPILKVAETINGFVILDGVLNYLAMIARGMQMAHVQIHDVAPEDYAYMSIKLNKRKKLTHRAIAHMIPVMTEWWSRHHADDKDRLRKFIAETLQDLGTDYSERNVQKLFDIIEYVPQLLDSMDNNDRIVSRFHDLAMDVKLGKEREPKKPAGALNTADDDDHAGCELGSGAPTGRVVELKIGDTVHKLDTGKFCRSCIVNRLVFEAVNPITPADQGIDPKEEGVAA